LWALVFSALIHLLLLGVLSFIRFSQINAVSPQKRVPEVFVRCVQQNERRERFFHKPRIKKAAVKSSNDRKYSSEGAKTLLKLPENSSPHLKKQQGRTVSGGFVRAGGPDCGIEVFLDRNHIRKICYVVDCSGSMKGTFSKVKERLAESISALEADQYFYIIFFGNEILFEFGGGRVVRASRHNKEMASEFINSIEPSGRTNAVSAFRRAVQVRDGDGNCPEVINFLTDGFELETNSKTLSEQIKQLLERFCPGTVINTIGFWPVESDVKILKTIAKQGGGRFELIEGGF